jgi:hypothetical protein
MLHQAPSSVFGPAPLVLGAQRLSHSLGQYPVLLSRQLGRQCDGDGHCCQRMIVSHQRPGCGDEAS